jgi:hypothetical protein
MASASHPVFFIALISNSTSDGHYLNLPVMNEGGEIVGMVDVLKLTYATLEQVSMADSTY